MTDTTIQRCWWKSTIIKKPIDQDPISQQDQDLQAQMTTLQAQITRLPIINPLSADEFIQVNGEGVDDELGEGDEEQIFQDIIDQYSTGNKDILEAGEDAIEAEEEDCDIPLSKAIQALETLRLYTLQREDGSETLLRELDQADRQFQAVLINQRKQQSIKSYFQ